MKKLLLVGGILGFTFLLAKSNNNLQPIPPADDEPVNTDAVNTDPVAPPKGTLSNNGSFSPGSIPVKPTGINTLPKNS